jgi:S1-C subfamily serine protease
LVTLRIYRDGRPRDVRVTLGQRPKQTGPVTNP